MRRQVKIVLLPFPEAETLTIAKVMSAGGLVFFKSHPYSQPNDAFQQAARFIQDGGFEMIEEQTQ